MTALTTDLDVHVVMDNAASHKTKLVRDWLLADDGVPVGIPAGEHRRVARQRARRVGEEPLEPGPFGRERVEVRGGPGLDPVWARGDAVARQRVGTGRVRGEESGRRSACRRPTPARGGRSTRERTYRARATGEPAGGPVADTLGDRCKGYELAEAGRRAMRGLPLLARLDGRAFHTFTRDLRRPYEHGMSVAMIETRALPRAGDAGARRLHAERRDHARVVRVVAVGVGLRVRRPVPEARVGAGGDGVGAVRASSSPSTSRRRPTRRRTSTAASGRCRRSTDAADVFVWREDDATKNSITMAAGAHYSDRELDGKNSGVKQEMLWQKGVNWNDFPSVLQARDATSSAERSTAR